MKSQLNPAWQRKPVSSDHLAEISARFLSDGPQAEQGADNCQVIPFFLDDKSLGWITEDLCRVLNQRGHKSQLLAGMVTGNGEQVQAETLSVRPETEYCLLPISDPASILSGQLSHVVLLVPADLDAVLTAYQRIKLMSRHEAPEIGIVMVGPRDQHAAWRYFRKLAVGALRYLDVPLLNLGFLPEQVTPENSPGDHHRDNFLTRISERLIRSGFHCRVSPATLPSNEPGE